MTDPELLAKRLALIETCVAELRRLARPEMLDTDVREERFVEHTLQIAIQAAQDVASHIVSDERLGEPRTNRELFDLLLRAGWLTESEVTLSLVKTSSALNFLGLVAGISVGERCQTLQKRQEFVERMSLR